RGGALPDITPYGPPTLLRLAFSVGLSGQIHIDGDPQAAVSELLRLARTGAIAEAAARANPARRVHAVVTEARSRWRLEIGGR
ncbi:MAG: hypothetical protein JWQ97_2918, partial [Phenylobacterium sp.]|nr:hypothetical protein [Phenylobacterium sp.]